MSNSSEGDVVTRKYHYKYIYLTLESRSPRCAPTKFEVATFYGLGGDAFARNVTDGRTHRRIGGRQMIKNDAAWISISTLSVSQCLRKQLVEPRPVQPTPCNK